MRLPLALAAALLPATLLGQGARSAPSTAPPPPATPKIAFEKYALPNGLQVILHVDRKLPIVHVNEWFHVGSKNEKPGRTGFAHLFEHMMFQGSKNATEKYLAYAEKLGSNLREGGVNGTTNNDRTNYFITAPSGNLETILWLESDRLATLTDGMTKEKLDNQRDVVKNERRQGLENQPYGRAFKLLGEALFPAGHPYSWPVIGSHEDLTAASLEDVTEFFKTYYTPNNLSLVIAGDFDPAEAKRLVEKYFAPIPPGPSLDRPGRWVPSLPGPKTIEVNDRVPQERVYLAWPSPPLFEAGDADLDLAATILSDGLSSRLQKALIYDRSLCTSVNAFQQSSEISGWFGVIATARPGASLFEVEKVIGEEISRLAKEGPTPRELGRQQTKSEYDFVSGLERIGGFGGKSDALNRYNTYLGDPGKLEEDLGRYRKATVASVRDAVARWLDTPNRVAVRFHPEASSRPAASTLDRAKEPPTGADRPFTTPAVASATLPNGLSVYVVERPELPKVAVTLTTRAGSIADPVGKEGLAELLIRTIDAGTKSRKALEIEEALGDLGTSLAGNVGPEGANVSFEVLERNLAAALEIAADVVQNPVFPAAEVDRERKRLLDQLGQDDKNANAVAARLRQTLTFGARHPYGRPVRGRAATVSALTREDLSALHARSWKAGSTALVFVGDVTLARATELAKRAFGSWAPGSAPPVAIPVPIPAAPGKIYVVDRQDAAQTVVSQFVPAPRRKTPDYDALVLADGVWGGGFGTRLNLNLREEKGWSYGVFSFPALRSEGGVWNAGGGVQTNKTKESVAEFVKELKGMSGARPVTEKELTDAKANHVRGFSQQFESLGRIAGIVADAYLLGLPPGELQRQVEASPKVPLADVNAVARKYLAPEKATLLLVGDLAKIQAGIEELKAGEVVVLDLEGQPVTSVKAANPK